MTDKEIFQQVLDVYEQAIIDTEPMTYGETWSYLTDKCLDDGVCYFLSNTLSIDIYTHGNMSVTMHNIIDKYKPRLDGIEYRKACYWYKTPANADTKEGQVDCLRKRIEILKQIIAEL